MTKLPEKIGSPQQFRPTARQWLGFTAASTVLGMALERVIFWMDVAAIGGAIVSLLGGGSITHVPKASHEIASVARAIPNDVIPPVRMPSIPKPETPPPSSSGYVTTATTFAGPATWSNGTNCMTSIPNGSTSTVVMTPCAITTSAGSGGGGSTVTTIGGGGAGGVTNGTVVITYGGEK